MNRKPVPGARQCCVLLALAIASWQPAAAQGPVETSGPYVHREAGAVFPVRVGEFRRSEVVRYDRAGRDVSASYNLAAPEGRLLITVYIYPAAAAPAGERAGRCEREFRTVKAAIRNQHGAAPPAEEGDALPVPGARRDLSHRAAYRLTIPFDREVQPVRSEAHLYCYVGGDWFVKYRVSAPVAVTAPGAVEDFIRTGPWPGRSSPETLAGLDPDRGEEPPILRSVEPPKQSGDLL